MTNEFKHFYDLMLFLFFGINVDCLDELFRFIGAHDPSGFSSFFLPSFVMTMPMSDWSNDSDEFDPHSAFHFSFSLPQPVYHKQWADWLIICFLHFDWLLIMCLLDYRQQNIFTCVYFSTNLNGLPPGVFNVTAFSPFSLALAKQYRLCHWRCCR